MVLPHPDSFIKIYQYIVHTRYTAQPYLSISSICSQSPKFSIRDPSPVSSRY